MLLVESHWSSDRASLDGLSRIDETLNFNGDAYAIVAGGRPGEPQYLGELLPKVDLS